MKFNSVKELSDFIDNHYKENDINLVISMTPREIWELLMDKNLNVASKLFLELSNLHDNLTTSIWYRGTQIVRIDKIKLS